MRLRQYQIDCLDAIQANQHKTNRPLVVLPTGTGKTVVFSQARQHLPINGQVFVLAHRDKLIRQAVDKITKWNPDAKVGIEMGSSYADIDCDYVVSSIQSIGRNKSKRLQRFAKDKVKAIIIDEAHHAAAVSYRRILDYFEVYTRKDIILIGVTATPKRGDGIGLDGIFQEIIYEMTLLDAIKQGWLVDLRCKRFNTQVDLDKVKSKAGDFDESELSKVINTRAVNAKVVENWKEHGENRKTVAFCVDIQHSKDLAAEFRAQGVPAEAVWGTDDEQDQKLKDHTAGKFKVLCNCQLLTEGYDDWTIECVLIARPMRSESMYKQCVGRGTRIPEGVDNLREAIERGDTLAKTECLIIDAIGVTRKHKLQTASSLLGLPHTADMNGATILEVEEKLAKLSKKVDPNKLRDLSKLELYVEEVSLFDVKFDKVVAKVSVNQWYSMKDREGFAMALPQQDNMIVYKMAEGWRVNGQLGETELDEYMPDKEAALDYADSLLRSLGSKYARKYAERVEANTQAPSSAKVKICQVWLGSAPDGQSDSEVQTKLNEHFALLRAKQRLEELEKKEKAA